MIHKILCLLVPGYRKRQQRISLLAMEGWSPRSIYLGDGYYRNILVRGGEYVHPRYTYTQLTDDIEGPVFDTTWDSVSNDDLGHFMIVVNWSKEKR